MIRLETPKVTRLRKTPTRPLSIAALAAVTLLAGCSGGGSISLGSGQTADPATVDFPVAYVKRSIPPNDDDLRQRASHVAQHALSGVRDARCCCCGGAGTS